MKDLGWVLLTWALVSAAIITIHVVYVEDHIPVSECHLAEIKWYNERPMCMECKLFCKVKK